MSAASLRDRQMAMAQYLRDPAHIPAPAGVEQRRLDVYQRLVYNSVEGFLSGGFPVLRSLYADSDWEVLARAFINEHRCRTPYFLEISQEFLHFLMHEYIPRDADPPFMVELAHYEWVELALDVAQESVPAEPAADADVLAGVPQLSPLAWLLCYQYPVHHIGPTYRPEEAGEATYLVVYRNRQERVRFMELNAVTARLLELTRDNSAAKGVELLEVLAAETGMAVSDLQEHGASQLSELLDLAVLGLRAPPCGD